MMFQSDIQYPDLLVSGNRAKVRRCVIYGNRLRERCCILDICNDRAPSRNKHAFVNVVLGRGMWQTKRGEWVPSTG